MEGYTAIEIGGGLQAALYSLERVVGIGIEDTAVIHPIQSRTVLFRITWADLMWQGLPAAEGLPKFLAVLPDRQLQLFGERVNHGRTDAVQTTCRFIDTLLELSARVGNRQDHRRGRKVLALVQHRVERHAARFVQNSYPTLTVDVHPDMLAKTGDRLVH